MDGEKPTALLGGRPLISYPLTAARETGLETLVVAKRATRLPPLAEPVLHEPDEPAHPLCGMLAALDFALARTPSPAVLFVGCDMPFLTERLLRWMAELGRTTLAEVGGQVQPLPVLCAAEHRAALSDSLAAQRSLRSALGALSPRLLEEAELRRFGTPERLWRSVNTPHELADAERFL